jgi:hypothetical protein
LHRGKTSRLRTSTKYHKSYTEADSETESEYGINSQNEEAFDIPNLHEIMGPIKENGEYLEKYLRGTY